MIFYRAIDPAGRTILAGTQADARAVNRDFKQIDIPTDKAGLMAFVQELYEQIDQLREEIHERAADLACKPISAEVVPDREPEADPPVPSPGREFDPSILEQQVELAGENPEEAFDAIASHIDLTGVGLNFARGVAVLNVVTTGEHQMARLMQRRKGKWK